MASLLDTRVAIVTGGSRGIGYAIAEALAGDGASVAISGTRDQHLKEAESQLSARFPGRILALRADVRDESQVAEAWWNRPSSDSGAWTFWSTMPASVTSSRWPP